MAKIKTLKTTLDNVDHQWNINCNSKGVFTISVDYNMKIKIGLEKTEYSSLSDLEKAVKEAIHLYKESTKVQELFILIKYQSSGYCSEDKKGIRLFDYSSKFCATRFSHGRTESSLCFDFEIVIKETIDSREQWYQAQKGHPKSPFGNTDPNNYYTGANIWNIEKAGVIVPFSEAAFNTLKNVKEQLRFISETLYSFFNQETEALSTLLANASKLLGQ